MAFSYGRQFRRIAAEALTADPDEMRALMQRILPAREHGAAPALRLETEADCQMAPAAIVAAFFADAITGDEAADLLRQTENPAFRKHALAERRAVAADLMPAFFRAIKEETQKHRAHAAEVLARWGRESAAERCSAANEAGELAKNKENTSGACCDAADRSAESTAPS
jgi:hypothetical protein